MIRRLLHDRLPILKIGIRRAEAAQKVDLAGRKQETASCSNFWCHSGLNASGHWQSDRDSDSLAIRYVHAILFQGS